MVVDDDDDSASSFWFCSDVCSVRFEPLCGLGENVTVVAGALLGFEPHEQTIEARQSANEFLGFIGPSNMDFYLCYMDE